MVRRTTHASIVPLVLLMTGIVSPVLGREEPKEGRPYLLDRVDDAAIVQLYADGFDDLPLQQKILVWHLYQAAIAGRDIYYDQRYEHGLTMRAVIEGIIRHEGAVDTETLKAVRHYAKLFWINSGPFNNLTARKFVLDCPFEEFQAAVVAAAVAGAPMPTRPGESPAALATRLRPMFFDPDFDPIVTNKTPGPNGDLLADSANNLYQGVSLEDLKGFEERYPLNSRILKQDGGIVEEPYRIGGRYSDQITNVVSHLEKAADVAPEPTAKALRALIRFYRSGETEDRQAYDIAWVQDTEAEVDTINGFIEVYMDARGVKGAWEAAVFYVDEEKTKAIEIIANEAKWFEDQMPFDPTYRKPDVRGITANAIEVIIETGDCGPITPIGINLPNDQTVRENYGSKSVSLANVIAAYDESRPTSFRAEFAWSPDEVERAERWSGPASELLVNMHEVIGHASGRASEDLDIQPQDAIREYYSALEEGRADLIALYFMAEPKLAELGLVDPEDQAELALTAYENFTRNALIQLRRVPEGNQIEEDHMRNRQLIVLWLMDNTNAIKRRKRDGKTYYVVTDPEAFRSGIGTLLTEVQRIKSEGDYEAAKALIENYGIRFEPSLRDEVMERVAALDLPSYTGFVMPRLEAKYDTDGAIVDVMVSYPMDLETQMLEYSASTQP